jgi:hypothetical protein
MANPSPLFNLFIDENKWSMLLQGSWWPAMSSLAHACVHILLSWFEIVLVAIKLKKTNVGRAGGQPHLITSGSIVGRKITK